MAIVFTSQGTVYGTAGTAVAETQTYTPAANGVLAAFIVETTDTTDPTSVTGHGLTFTQIAKQTSGNSTDTLWLYAAFTGGSPTSVATTANWAASRTTYLQVFEIAGADVSGLITAVFVQTVSNTGTANPTALALAAGSAAANRPLASALWRNNSAGTQPTSWTLDTTPANMQGGSTSPARHMLGTYRSDAFDTNASIAPGGATPAWIEIATEIKAAAAGGGRGLFLVPSLSGVGIGGSFFRDPLQAVRL